MQNKWVQGNWKLNYLKDSTMAAITEYFTLLRLKHFTFCFNKFLQCMHYCRIDFHVVYFIMNFILSIQLTSVRTILLPNKIEDRGIARK